MAFLCPSRLGRNKHKRGYQSMMRRLTEGDRLDTLTLEDLVKLSWTTPESRRIIMQNFTSCESQEINVKQGQKVNYIYREGDWAYIVTDDKKEGFVPFIFLAKIGVPPNPTRNAIDTGTYTKRCSELNPRNFSVESEETDHSGSDLADDTFTSPGWSTDSGSVTTVQDYPSVNFLKTEPFEKVPMFYEVFLDERTNILHKNPLPSPGRSDDNEIPDNNNNQRLLQFKVLFNFAGLDLYDVSVKPGEIVDLLDDSDPGWFLVRRSDGYEGYLPSNYITQLTEQHTRDFENSDNEALESRRVSGHEKSPVDKTKADQNEIPKSWKITNDLKGKSPITTANDITDDSNKQKKQRPKKPPRKKKASLDGLSPRLDESVDSIDTFISESSAEYLDNAAKSPLDELSPRSDDYSDSSVFESSFNGIYGYRQCARGLSDMELSPRSLNVQSYDGSTSDEKSVRKGNERLEGQTSLEERGGNIKSASRNRRETQESNRYGRNFSCETSDSFESRSSYGQRQKRPVSMPAFSSYQEYKKDYYDEYFYDDADTKFANKSKHDVINVAEILRMRNANKNKKTEHSHLKQRNIEKNSEKYHQIRKSSSAAESKDRNRQCSNRAKNSQNQPKLKQFLLDLPLNKMEKQNIKTNRQCSEKNDDINVNYKVETSEHNHSSKNLQKHNNARSMNEFYGKDVKYKSPETTDFHQKHVKGKPKDNQSRKYNSSSDLRQVETKHSVANTDYGLDNELGNVSIKNNKENKKTHIRPYNSSTDLREIGGKPDWSFGYPRRTKQSIGRQENRRPSGAVTHNTRRGTKSSEKSNGADDGLDQGIALKNNMDLYNLRQNPESRTVGGIVKTQQDDDNEVFYNGNEDVCFDDGAMMALLNQTDNLLSKTDRLLHRDKNDRTFKQEVNCSANQNNPKIDKHHKEIHRNDNNVIKDTKSCSTLHHSEAETDAVNKCNLFLNNSTIGIHGITYSITETNSENVSTDNIDGNINSEIQCCSLQSCQSMDSDSRKEKSNVMKDNSSKVVSAEIKSMDLHDIRGITEFVCQCDCDNDNEDMLPIKYGEIIHIGLDGQGDGDKYWAYSPALKKYGFVHKQNVKIPMVTII